MELLLYRILGLSLSGGAAVCLLVLASPLCRRFFTPGWKRLCWFFPLALFCLPFARVVSSPAIDPLSPAEILPHRPAAPVLPAAGEVPVPAIGEIPAPSAGLPVDLTAVLVLLWGAGMLLFVLWHAAAYLRLARLLRRCRPVEDTALLACLDGCRGEMGYAGTLRPLYCPGVISPMVTGLLRPALVLPEDGLEGLNLELALCHELIHLRRRDLWLKALALLVNAFHWFNPLAYLLVRELDRDCELACDAALIQNLDRETRKHYGAMLLDMLGRTRSGTPQNLHLSTSLCPGQRALAHRLNRILDPSPRKGRPALAAILSVCLCCAGLLTACSVNPPIEAGPTSQVSHRPDEPGSSSDDSGPEASSAHDSEAPAAAGGADGPDSVWVNSADESDLLAPQWPIPGHAVVVSPFGWRNNGLEYHLGADLSAPLGSHAVASLPGRVSVGRNEQLGDYLAIDHGGGYQTLYSGYGRRMAEEGDYVEAGSVVVTVGQEGTIHFECQVDGRSTNPLFLFDSNAFCYQYTRTDGGAVRFRCFAGEYRETAELLEQTVFPPFTPPAEKPAYDSKLDAWYGHTGIDYIDTAGSPVYAVAGGIVTYSGYEGLYGNHIIIDHGGGQSSLYGHCGALLVKTGDEVKAGDEISSIGITGAGTGPHLHFEYRLDGLYLDVSDYLNR